MEVKVSIIVPVYNVASYLDACLSSCVNQTFCDMEIIVVNDGSTDESSLIIAEYAAKDERIVVVTKTNEGVVIARKSGLDIARGDYVFFLDGDDYLEIDALEKLYDEVINQEADYIVADFYEVLGDKRFEVWRNNRMRGLSGEDFFLCMLRGGFELWARLIRKSLFEGIVHKPLVMGEDLFITMQIMPKVKKPVVVDACLYNYVRRADSITNQKDELIWTCKFDMVRSVFSLLDIYPYNQQIRDRVYLMFYPFFLECMSQKKIEIKTILYDFYWNKTNMKSFLWRKRKDFYFIIHMFFISPFMAGLMAKLYLKMHSLRCRYR